MGLRSVESGQPVSTVPDGVGGQGEPPDAPEDYSGGRRWEWGMTDRRSAVDVSRKILYLLQ